MISSRLDKCCSLTTGSYKNFYIFPQNTRYNQFIFSNSVQTSSLLLKKAKNKSSKNSKIENSSAIDKLLDELSDDEEESFSSDTNSNSPVALFLNKQRKPNKAKGDKGKSKAISVPYSEVCKFVNVDGYWRELDTIVQDQKDFFLHHITIRSASAIDELPIDFDGDTYPLREIADISKKDPKKVIIDTSAIPQATKDIMNALQSKVTMNLNPQQEGTRIYVPIPKVTKESRQKLIKSAQARQTQTIDMLKKSCNKKVSDLTNAKLANTISISEDQLKGIIEVLHSIESHFLSLTKEMTNQKQQDLLNK